MCCTYALVTAWRHILLLTTVLLCWIFLPFVFCVFVFCIWPFPGTILCDHPQTNPLPRNHLCHRGHCSQAGPPNSRCPQAGSKWSPTTSQSPTTQPDLPATTSNSRPQERWEYCTCSRGQRQSYSDYGQRRVHTEDEADPEWCWQVPDHQAWSNPEDWEEDHWIPEAPPEGRTHWWPPLWLPNTPIFRTPADVRTTKSTQRWGTHETHCVLHWVSDLQTGQRPHQNPDPPIRTNHPDPPIRTNHVRSDELNQVRGTLAKSPHRTRGPPGQFWCHKPIHAGTIFCHLPPSPSTPVTSPSAVLINASLCSTSV